MSDAVDLFLEDKRRKGLQASTIDAYGYKLGALQEYTPPGIMVRHVTAAHVRPYIHDAEVTNATQRSRYRHVRAFFSWTKEQSLIEDSPMEGVAKPRKEEKAKAFLRPDDVEIGLSRPTERCEWESPAPRLGIRGSRR